MKSLQPFDREREESVKGTCVVDDVVRFDNVSGIEILPISHSTTKIR